MEKDADLTYQREVVDAFLAASRSGNFDALLAVLDPNVVFRADRVATAAGSAGEIRGAQAVAKQFSGRAQGARPALVNGGVGVLVVRQGRLFLVLKLTLTNGKITEINAIAAPEQINQFDLAVLED